MNMEMGLSRWALDPGPSPLVWVWVRVWVRVWRLWSRVRVRVRVQR